MWIKRLAVVGLCVGVSACSGRRYVRLVYPDDYRVPDSATVRQLQDTEVALYRRGYEKGWREYASRWRLAMKAGKVIEAENDGVICQSDGTPFGRGFCDGQIAAARVAEQKFIDALGP